MIDTRTRKAKEITSLPELNSKRSTPGLSRNLNEFLQSLGDVLIDITALEVNTMVVERITGDKFIAWQAYRDIYPISEEYLEQQGVDLSLRDRYLELRKNLELAYTLILADATSEFYDPNVLQLATEEKQILTDPTVKWQEIYTRLPNPTNSTSSAEILKAQQILQNCRFLRSLRKISELKAALDNRNRALQRRQDEQLYTDSEAVMEPVLTDLIYAQTVIQLDGEIINRYSQEIFAHPHREVILGIHQQGVIASEKQWRGLLEFIIGLVQTTLQRGGAKNFYK
jgi:hypothetical protein